MPVSFVMSRLSKMAVRQGRSKRDAEAYLQYVEALSDARTQLAVIFDNLNRKGATGFDGDTEVTVACRALGDS